MRRFVLRNVMLLFGISLVLSLSDMPAGAWTQEFLWEETAADSRLTGPAIDWRGSWYFVRWNTARTVSYIYKDLTPSDRDTPFITVDGRVEGFAVTPDEDASYMYYTISGRNGVYRLPLRQGATNAEYREFPFGDTDFLFDSMVLAKNPNEFLLTSKVDGDRNVVVGLFSFDGGTEPSKTWTCTLPQEWKDSYTPIAPFGGIGYDVVYEASTERVWLRAIKSFFAGTEQSNKHFWFFTKKISDEGALEAWDPAPEMPDWGIGNLKLLHIDRYSRTVVEYQGSFPGTIVSCREYDPVARALVEESLTSWTDRTGTVRPIGDFSPRLAGTSWITGLYLDAQKNFYATYYNAGTYLERFARFTSATPIDRPEADPSMNDAVFGDGGSVVLKATPFGGPTGYAAKGSRWEVYRVDPATSGKVFKASGTPVYSANQNGAADAHRVTQELGEGSYAWRMAYDWEYAGATETMRGSTNWSELATFGVRSNSPVTPEPDVISNLALSTDAPYYVGTEYTAVLSLTRSSNSIGVTLTRPDGSKKSLRTVVEEDGKEVRAAFEPETKGRYTLTARVRNELDATWETRTLDFDVVRRGDAYEDGHRHHSGCNGTVGTALLFLLCPLFLRKRGS